MKTGVIIMKKGNARVPDDFLKLVLGQNDTFLAASFVHKADKKPPVLMRTANVDDVTLERFNAGQTAFEDTILLSYLGQASEEIPQSNYQPFTALADKDGNALIYAYLEGDFSPFHHPKDVKSDAAFAVEKYLTPKLISMYNASGMKIEKLEKLLDDDMFKVDLQLMSAARGIVVLQLVNGKMFCIEKNNELSKEFDWGWASNTFGYVDKPVVVEPEVPAADARLAAFGSSALPKAGPTSNVQTKELEPEPASQAGFVAFGSRATPVAASEEKAPIISTAGTKTDVDVDTVWLAPPKEVHGKQGLKNWYRRWSLKGDHPANWKERPSIRVLKDQAVDCKGYIDKTKNADGTPAVVDNTTSTAPKPFVASLAPRPEENVQEHKPPKGEPMFTDDDKKQVALFLKRHNLDISSKAILSAAEIQALEDKYPSFCEAFGFDGLEVPLGWSLEIREDFCATRPREAAYLMTSFANEYGKLLSLLDGMTAAHGVNQPTDKPVKVPDSRPEPQAAPRKVAFGSMQ